MFKSINYSGSYAEHYHYYLIDSEFECPVSVNNVNFRSTSGWYIAPRLIMALTEYQKRQLPVPRNIALLYLYCASQFGDILTSQLFEGDRLHLNTYFTRFNYDKYVDCIKNQIRQLQFGKSHPIIL